MIHITLDWIIIGGLLLLITMALLAVIGLRLLFRCCGVTVTASVTHVEQKMKYYDSSIDKRIAYDYGYRFMDCHGQEQHGKIYKNASSVELDPNDMVEVLYLRFCPRFSVYKPLYEALSFVPWIVAVMWLVLLCIFVMTV